MRGDEFPLFLLITTKSPPKSPQEAMVLSIMIPSRNTGGVFLSVEALERLAVMRSLETNAQYSIPDYLSTGWQSRLWRATVLGGHVGTSMDFSASVMVDVVPPTRILSSSSRQGAADDGDDVSLLSSSSFNDQIIHEGWRDQVCQWTYAVADYFGEIIVSSFTHWYLVRNTTTTRIPS
jgi:hypothetical protein